ncbi:hypothetical protein [Paenibacillus agricola]|uniref:Lipoprotein n=1 Tax=Paenibacillus agricola TaxID=2716264 RepID=A0ABX0JB57_9BACL|nr:hypothetical protein [Paenibacillus agricola]NHN32464.1 hypothetical protein [Paenibacillus agricola]
MHTKKAITAFVLTAVLLSGCGGGEATPSAANQTSANSAQAQVPASPSGTATDPTKQQGATANPNQRVMMMTFQSLIAMDKTSGLTITKEQAAQMLPLVQDGITKNELSADAQTSLIAPLTAEQKKFIEDTAAKAKERGNGQGAGQRAQGDGAGAGGAGQAAPNAQAAPGGAGGQRPQGDAGAGGQGGASPQTGQNGQQRPAGGQGGSPGVNSGQQLVELLQAKK